MINNLLKYLSPITRKYDLYYSNIGSDDLNKIVFKFKSIITLNLPNNHQTNDIEDILQIVIDAMEDYYFKHNYKITLTIFSSINNTCKQISHPFSYNLYDCISVNALYDSINWINMKEAYFKNEIIVIVTLE